jgi:hypothetical protein
MRKSIAITFKYVIVRSLVFLGMFAAMMFVLGYLYASIPLAKTCTPTLIDKVLK